MRDSAQRAAAPQSTGAFDLDGYLSDLRERIDAALRERLPDAKRFTSVAPLPAGGLDVPSDSLQLKRAMAQAVLAGGKRLRPCLTLAAAQAVGGETQHALGAACAVEMIHSYSLVHDDLPAMDDDDFRRGKPTCHKQYGEAAAILAGDALLTLAFQVLADEALARPEAQRAYVRASTELARAAGNAGMVGGQALDMSLKDNEPTFELLELCHRGKTAALFSAATVIGALVGGGDDEQVELLRRYGVELGLAFQHADDLRDAEFVNHRERALARAVELSRSAALAARTLGAAAAPLAAMADLVERRATEVVDHEVSSQN